jgi:hypothetical protein
MLSIRQVDVTYGRNRFMSEFCDCEQPFRLNDNKCRRCKKIIEIQQGLDGDSGSHPLVRQWEEALASRQNLQNDKSLPSPSEPMRKSTLSNVQSARIEIAQNQISIFERIEDHLRYIKYSIMGVQLSIFALMIVYFISNS